MARGQAANGRSRSALKRRCHCGENRCLRRRCASGAAAAAHHAQRPPLPLYATSRRRQIIVAVLLCLALVGAAIRQWADNPSLLRDVGSLLLVLWLPVIGQIIAFLIGKIPRSAPVLPAFAPDQPFAPHVTIALTPAALDLRTLRQPPPAEQALLTLVVGSEGFRARVPGAVLDYLGAAEVPRLELEFLRPEHALPRLPVGAAFVVLWGMQAVGKGTVLTAVQRPGA